MDEKLSELVSAWLDGELRRGERRRGARELARRTEARERLGRYRLIGEALRGGRREPADPGFARSVAAAVERERPARPRFAWLRPPRLPAPALALGAAALLAVGLWLGHERRDPGAGPAVAEAPAPAARPAPPRPALRDYRDYLAAHAEYAAPPMTMPYAQLLDYAE